MVIIAHVPILLFELQMRAPRYPESGTEVAAAGRGTAPGGTRMGFPVTSVSICYPLFYFQMLNGFYRLQMECYPKCFCFVLGFFFPNRSVRRCERGKGNSLWAELANKMSLVWVVFMEWSVHADVTSTNSLGKYRLLGWYGCNSSFSFSTRCCRITQNMSNTGWEMYKFRGLCDWGCETYGVRHTSKHQHF